MFAVNHVGQERFRSTFDPPLAKTVTRVYLSLLLPPLLTAISSAQDVYGIFNACGRARTLTTNLLESP